MNERNKKMLHADKIDIHAKEDRATFKVNKFKYDLFKQLCYENDTTCSAVLRKAVDDYIKKNNGSSQGQLFDIK